MIAPRLVVVACPDCFWTRATTYVPQACPVDWRHDPPRMVRAWLYCEQGCFEGEFATYQTCPDRAEHIVQIDPERSRFL